ncbi:MAG: acyl carrier protein [Armatimonadota bacterium]|nr:acyl carrier protein [Armatimonadota bacterium]MCX7777451.1 acyl carrier protein [Armatimonadota bacterium]MDW8025541.1 acyl carrier protein [Armatimonadota bacterium]
MTQDEIKARLKGMLIERLFLNVTPDEIPDDQPLMEALGIDSVALFEVVVGLEDEFGITLEESEFDISLFRDINTMAHFVETKLAAA